MPSWLREPARRLAAIEPFRVMAILARAKELEAQGRDIIHLEIGELDFPTPAPIVAAGIAALEAGQSRYTPALGLPELRAAIAQHYRERLGVAIAPERVVVTTGASGALLLALAAVFDAGDELLLADPGYPCNRHIAEVLGIRPRPAPLAAAERFQATAAWLARHWSERTRGVLLANPNNPTGTVISAEELAAIHAEVRRRQGWLLVDEIYHELIHEPGVPTALSLGDDVLVINSFSKYFQMSGWRLGWLVLPEALVPGVERLAQNLFLCAPSVAQQAALAAFSSEVQALLQARKAELRQRREFLLEALVGLGFRVPAPAQGAFYIYADCRAFAEDSEVFAEQLLLETGVAVTPGADFGTVGAGQHIRIAYTAPMARLEEAVRRLRAYLA